jgi:hypothetical protein
MGRSSREKSAWPSKKIKWSDVDISFGPEDHPETELFGQNLPFMVKLPIGRHKVAKILIDNSASLNLIMRKAFIEMGPSLKDLTPIHDTFYGVIPGQSSTPIGCIDLEVSCGTWDNKRKEMLTFVVDSFDIGYNCILGRPFLLKFMAVIHTAYATIKMPDPKGVITIKADQWDALACESEALSQVGRFGAEATQKQSTKMAKTQGDNIPLKTSSPKPRSPAPHDLLQQRKAHMLPQHPISNLPISRRMTRRRGLTIKKF